MPHPTGPGSRPRKVYEQPQEGRPSGLFDLKVQQLRELRERISVARNIYVFDPTPANEATLRRLIAQDDALYSDIAFGIAPEIRK